MGVTVKIKKVKLLSIKPNPNNPRKISDQEMTRMITSIKEFPEMLNIREIVVDESMTVLGGNQRWLALQRSGASECLAKIVIGLTDAQKREFIIKDNGTYGEWDLELLKADWGDAPLIEWGVDLPELLIDDNGEQDNDAEPQIDRAEELNKIWQVKSGDLWQIGEHRLLCGDSTKKEDVERVMGGEKAGLMNTDPPYGVNYANNERPNHGAAKPRVANDELKDEKLQAFLEMAFRVAVDEALLLNAAWYMWHAHLSQGYFAAAAAAAAANVVLHRQIVWVKPVLLLGRGYYHWKHEPCFMGWIKGNQPPDYGLGKGERSQTTVWEVASVSQAERKAFNHSTPKPTELFAIPIVKHLQPGEFAYEPFAGSGPQFVACQNLNRKCRGIETSEDYCAVILQRMADAFPGIEIKRLSAETIKQEP